MPPANYASSLPTASAAEQPRQKATKAILDNEEAETQKLRDLGMTVIGAEDGLSLDALRTSVSKLIDERSGAEYGDLCARIAAVV